MADIKSALHITNGHEATIWRWPSPRPRPAFADHYNAKNQGKICLKQHDVSCFGWGHHDVLVTQLGQWYPEILEDQIFRFSSDPKKASSGRHAELPISNNGGLGFCSGQSPVGLDEGQYSLSWETRFPSPNCWIGEINTSIMRLVPEHQFGSLALYQVGINGNGMFTACREYDPAKTDPLTSARVVIRDVEPDIWYRFELNFFLTHEKQGFWVLFINEELMDIHISKRTRLKPAASGLEIHALKLGHYLYWGWGSKIDTHAIVDHKNIHLAIRTHA